MSIDIWNLLVRLAYFQYYVSVRNFATTINYQQLWEILCKALLKYLHRNPMPAGIKMSLMVEPAVHLKIYFPHLICMIMGQIYALVTCEPPTFSTLVPLGGSAARCISALASKKDPKINRIIRNNLLRIFEILGFVELILQIHCASILSRDCQGGIWI